MTQTPATGDYLLRWRGDVLDVTLTLDAPRPGRAALRTNIGRAGVRRREIVAETEEGMTPLARAWTDVPLEETSPGVFTASLRLDEVGVFSAKACFFPEGSDLPEWPEGPNFHVKVESAETRERNSIYCVFPRQFGSFREVARRLDHIMDKMGFRIVQTLPPFPVPTTYAVMGKYGCPFAATDFFSVDPAMAEFDEAATPLDQFKELIGAVHARKGLLFVDLPANHTGWASALQTHHPEWFRRESDGSFRSPGAWGVVWKDLVELDYSNAGLRAYMAEVFLFWCRNGVDGFRCDAGYMIPTETWTYIVAKVREEYPDTVFLLEGLGGDIAVTDRLLAESGLDWAYSEIFQTYDRSQFEWYLPQAVARAEKYGTLVHFAETHDNDRLACGGETYARLRVSLAALLSWQGAWGIANGVEWFCREKIDVHDRNDLAWGAEENMVDLVAKLNSILATEPTFSGGCGVSLVTRGDGNTLAVVRRRGGFAPVLVVANLDCKAAASVCWDAAAFPPCDAVDLVSGRKCRAEGPLRLAPGEVMCLRPAGASVVPADEAQTPAPVQAEFHVVMPRDAARDVVVPEGRPVEISADVDFRVRLEDPATGRTFRVMRSSGRKVVLITPRYEGDGTRCRCLQLAVSRYVGGRAVRSRSRFLVPPPADAAKMKRTMYGAEVRNNPWFRTVLSNGAGASAQVRVGWGVVESQYDALFAANPCPDAPADRLLLWTRARCWLQREGYVRELDAKCVTGFTADPAGRFARWNFRVPCGMGLETSFVFTLSLAAGANAARLTAERTESGGGDPPGSVRLVFRPDVEWRSFHSTTKAYIDGVDGRFRSSCEAVSEKGAQGFDFHPYGGRMAMRVSGGEYHHEPQWTYGVGHPEEASRGLDGSGDLFSPGWISADLAPGGSIDIVCSLDGAAADFPAHAFYATEASFADSLRESIGLFIARRGDFKTVIAGYPWFLDWGRDTFIAMRGMIAAGMYSESLAILKAFAAFEEKGTLPNIIFGASAGNRDTSDAPLWFVRCVAELGGKASSLIPVCDSIVDGYLAGTPNGIKVDPESALVWSPSHFTWMDTNLPACTPRIGYPIEIQALWISALRFLGRDALAEKALASVKKLFALPGGGYADCLDAPDGRPAAAASQDGAVRPNQLLLVSLGVLRDESIVRATEALTVPGGIRSLAAGHYLYRGVYAGDEDSSRKPAYHNGTVWTWQFPMFVEAMCDLGLCTAETALSLLASAVENLNTGCLCHMSEIADGDAPHAQKGCCAQAWGDSELLRVWLKLLSNRPGCPRR